MNGEMKDYRQPMVTSLGIILGFMLNFLAGWATGASPAIQDTADALILGTIAVSIVLMLLVLYRILNGHYPDADTSGYYRLTLRLYMLAIGVAFVGFAVAVLL